MSLEPRMTDTDSIATTAEARLKDVKAFFNNGEFFRAYDLATEALEQFPGDVPLAHRAVLSLANAGATALALEKYYAFGLDSRLETDIRSLLGRLKKDQAFAETGEARAVLFREGRAIYEGAFRMATVAHDPESYYPAINAATLALFGGDPEAANRLAGKVLDLLEPRIAALSHSDSPDRYWVLATALEASLIRGDLDAARGLVDAGVAASGNDHAALATTGRQLERIVQAKGLDPSVLGVFEPPTIIHFVGHMIAAPGKQGRFETVQAPMVAAKIAAVLDGMRIGA